MNNLGTLYEGGFGAEQDYDEAIKWYQAAADTGNEDAKANLIRLKKSTPRPTNRILTAQNSSPQA